MRFSLSAVGLLASLTSVAQGQAARARWTIDPQPAVTIGQSEADTNEILAVVAGATRLPDGRILVGDRSTYSLRLFSPNGKHERGYGRKGKGPGEISYLSSLLRCGDSVVTMDVDGQRTSVFALDGTFVRAFRFGSAQPGRPPYETVCNHRGVFAHYGWEDMSQIKGGAYRTDVPFWLSAGDSAVRRVIGTFPGAERYGQVVGGQVRGSRPLPLGKRPVIALGADRVYIGTADRYEIQAFDLSGKRVATIRADHTPRPVTDDDIVRAREFEIAENGERTREGVERSWATMTFPKTLPAYDELVVDNAQNLWVRDYPRAGSHTVVWRVFDPNGTAISHVELPAHLTVYEIGSDYVLGKYLDPEESIPHVRLYRLKRGS